MPALLPFIRKAVSLQTPRKGQRGVFKVGGDDGSSGTANFNSVLPAICDESRSTWASTRGHSTIEELQSMAVHRPVIDELMSKPWTPASQALKPHTPLQIRNKPHTPRSDRRRDLRKQHDREAAEMRRHLRGLQPGDWDATHFIQLRSKCIEERNFTGLSAITQAAYHVTDAAVQEGCYRFFNGPAKPRTEVSIPSRQHTQWFGFENLQTPLVNPNPLAAPLICAPLAPLEVAEELAKQYPRRAIILNMPVAEFTPDGSTVLPGDMAQRLPQQELFIRTNLKRYCDHAVAVRPAASAETTIRSHLAAASNPYVFAAHDVNLFRGAPDDGYPLMKKPVEFHMIISGRSNNRPQMSNMGEYYAMHADMLAAIDRLNLVAMAAMDIGQLDAYAENQSAHMWDNGGNGSSSTPSSHRRSSDPKVRLLAHEEATEAANAAKQPTSLKPILILSMHDLTENGAQQPRNSLAAALKSWRETYAEFFEVVVVACKDKKTAALFDKQVNSAIYASAFAGKRIGVEDWGLNLKVTQLSVNNSLTKLLQKALNGQSSDAMSEATTPMTTTNHRKMSTASMSTRMIGESEVQLEADMQMKKQKSMIGSPTRRQTLKRDSKAESLIPPPTLPSPQNMSSRAICERKVALRLGDMNAGTAQSDASYAIADTQKTESYQNATDEKKAMAGVARATAIGAFSKVGLGARGQSELVVEIDAVSEKGEDWSPKAACTKTEAEDFFEQVQALADKTEKRMSTLRLDKRPERPAKQSGKAEMSAPVGFELYKDGVFESSL